MEDLIYWETFLYFLNLITFQLGRIKYKHIIDIIDIWTGLLLTYVAIYMGDEFTANQEEWRDINYSNGGKIMFYLYYGIGFG